MDNEMPETDPARVRVALEDPAYGMPPVPDGGPEPGIRWLRRNVARFSDGPAHARRRLHVTRLLEATDPVTLRQHATRETRAVLDEAGSRPVEVMARIARPVPLKVIATASGMSAVPLDAVTAVAKAYQPGPGEEAAADHAVVRLVDALGGVADEFTAARIGLLVQACDATAGLIGNAVLRMARGRTEPAERVVAEALRDDPPVRATRRVSADGRLVTLDLAAAAVPFGSGPHQCPGRDHAVAVAEGVVAALHGCRLVERDVEYLPSAVLRVPARLVVTR